ncbi:YrdB family protein [Nocardia sp. NBC_00508]|uniref:YrdB family protein n=1 Tax=Nocardia sp. NBC_00508 TaxID=2975992 RepID=UPI002E813432|nr:YrdB family protein [Nocardia sp. NBC_00508]WUD67748.1 YrdB family protein [Nocardia sp. NBC_00508]
MSLNPVMLAVRFLLELVAVASFGVFGWRAFEGPWKFLLVVALPVVAVALWQIFSVPGDPSRGGRSMVAVSGSTRLVIELSVLGGGALALQSAGLPGWGVAFAVLVIVYHALAYDRVVWLLSRK